MIQSRDFTPEQLEQFKLLQRRAYATLEEAAESLRPGVSEKDVARQLQRAFAAQGVHSYFHMPVALFGERTAYPGDFGQFEALPTGRRLADGDAVILDAAPIYDGYTVDVSLAVPRPGKEVEFARADELLHDLRLRILHGVRQHQAMRHIARDVDQEIRAQGFVNCHRKHIGKVLAHRVTRAPKVLAGRRIWGLSPLPVGWFFWRSYRAGTGKPSLTPNWNDTRQSECLPQPGLWAVEPHVGLGALGSKFEEILVITQSDAWYLDDALPHHRRWAQRSSSSRSLQ
ncbi:MAG TPA: M24 family metallopeptidase [Solimonas sp.]|nr:M24 family metallopeptidase [Solimonas sp.]